MWAYDVRENISDHFPHSSLQFPDNWSEKRVKEREEMAKRVLQSRTRLHSSVEWCNMIPWSVWLSFNSLMTSMLCAFVHVCCCCCCFAIVPSVLLLAAASEKKRRTKSVAETLYDSEIKTSTTACSQASHESARDIRKLNSDSEREWRLTRNEMKWNSLLGWCCCRIKSNLIQFTICSWVSSGAFSCCSFRPSSKEDKKLKQIPKLVTKQKKTTLSFLTIFRS